MDFFTHTRLFVVRSICIAALAAPAFALAADDEAAPSCAEFMSYNIQQKLGFMRDFDIGDPSKRGRAKADALEEFCKANPDANTADIRGASGEEMPAE